jgi:Tol biopolymer transport system component
LDATPNGQQLAVVQQTVSRIESNTDIWLMETARGVPRQFTFHPAFEISPVWSPDGSRVVFSSNRNGAFDLFEKPVTFARDESVLRATPNNKFAVDWSPDGNTLLFVAEESSTGDDLWTLPIRDPQSPTPFLVERHAESQGQFSPDGRWVAYRSNESGRWEIYLRPFPGPGSQQKLSSGGGIQPRWRSDGQELFYVGADSRMMAVPIQLPNGGEPPVVGAPKPLFAVRIANAKNQQFGYVVDPTGQRLLIHVADNSTSTAPMTIVQNWTSTLSK